MAHSNNGSSDLDAWIALFGQVGEALGSMRDPDELYEKLLPLAVAGDPDAGGLLSINYVSGEHITGFTEGRPLFARHQNSRFTLQNFVRAMLFASLCAMRAGIEHPHPKTRAWSSRRSAVTAASSKVATRASV